MIDLLEFSDALKTRFIGREVCSKEEMTSTNQLLLEGADDAPSGTLAICETQTAGRGRQRRLWHSPTGLNLYFSLLLKPPVPIRRFPQLAMLTAIGLHRALRTELPEVHIDLKWPNDLWHQGRKLSGILCECPPAASSGKPSIVIGIGLNVNAQPADFPPELQNTASSLAIAAGRKLSREQLLAGILNSFESIYRQWLKADDLTPFLEEWAQYDLLTGREINVTRPNDTLRGTVNGITKDGLLRLRLTTGEEVVVSAGDTHIGRLN